MNAVAEPDPVLHPILSRHLGRIDPPPNDERCPNGTALATMLPGRSSAPYTLSGLAATVVHS